MIITFEQAAELLQHENRPMTPAEVGALFHVKASTVSRWANQGRIKHFRTLGGHRRFSTTEVRRLLSQNGANGAHEVSVGEHGAAGYSS